MLARALQLGLDPQHEFFSRTQNLELAYFGTLYTVMGGWAVFDLPRTNVAVSTHADGWNGRSSAHASFRCGPTFVKMASPLPSLIATAVQLVSPWDEAASLYTRYVRASDKQKRKGKFA